MTTYAYNFLSETQKEQICFLEISYEKSKASLAIDFYQRCSMSHYMFEYEQSGTTTVITHNYHKGIIEVEDSNIWTVFCSDLETFLKNQKIRLKYFKIIRADLKKPRLDDSFVEKIHSCVENSRVQRLQVENLVFAPSKMSQLTRLLDVIKLEYLESAYISLKTTDESLDIGKLMELKKFEDAAPLHLDILKEEITMEDLVLVKEIMLKSTTIRQLELRCSKTDQDALNLIFGKPISPDKISFDKIHRASLIPDSHDDKLIVNSDSVDNISYLWIIDFYRERFFEKTENSKKSRVFLEDEDFTELFESLFSATNKSVLAVFGNPLILRKILEPIAFFEIQSLQCVSTLLRDTIAIVKPDPKIDEVQIELQSFGPIVLGIRVGKPLQKRVVYLETEVDHYCNKRTITPDPHSKCLEDLARTLKFQNTPLKKFKLFFSSFLQIKRPPGTYDMETISCDDLIDQFDEFVEKLADILEARAQKLKVEFLDMVVLTEDNTIKIMKNLEPGTIQTIQMVPYYIFMSVNVFNIKKLCELEQWSRVEELCMRDVVITSGFEGLTHFAKASIEVGEITEETLLYLKENLLASKKLIKYEVNFKSTTIDNSNFDLLGPPYVRPNDPMAGSRRVWYFRYADNDDVLLMLFFIEKKRVILSRVDIDDVPDDAFL